MLTIEMFLNHKQYICNMVETMNIPKPFYNIGGIDLCIQHPSCTINIWDECQKYVKNCRNRIEELLLTTGIHKTMMKEGHVDYPPHQITRYKSFIREMFNYAKKYSFYLLYTIPDIPTNYRGKPSFWSWNVKRTIDYIREFKNYMKPNSLLEPIPMVPGIPDDPHSVLQVYNQYKEIYEEFPIIGLGQIISNKRDIDSQLSIITDLSTTGKKLFLFGYPLKVIKKAMEYGVDNIYGFLSTSFHWKGREMVSGRIERTEALKQYMVKVENELQNVERIKSLSSWLG